MAEPQREAGDLFSANVTVTVGGLLALAVAGLTFLHWYLPDYRGTIVFFSIAVTAAAGLAGSFYIANTLRLQLDQSRENSRRRPLEVALILLARWNDPDIFDSRSSCNAVLEKYKEKGNEGVVELLENAQTAQQVRHILNFFEEIAMLVKGGYADEELVAGAFSGLVTRTYSALAGWIIEHRRTSGRDRVWIEFQWLNDRWLGR